MKAALVSRVAVPVSGLRHCPDLHFASDGLARPAAEAADQRVRQPELNLRMRIGPAGHRDRPEAVEFVTQLLTLLPA